MIVQNIFSYLHVFEENLIFSFKNFFLLAFIKNYTDKIFLKYYQFVLHFPEKLVSGFQNLYRVFKVINLKLFLIYLSYYFIKLFYFLNQIKLKLFLF